MGRLCTLPDCGAGCLKSSCMRHAYCSPTLAISGRCSSSSIPRKTAPYAQAFISQNAVLIMVWRLFSSGRPSHHLDQRAGASPLRQAMAAAASAVSSMLLCDCTITSMVSVLVRWPSAELCSELIHSRACRHAPRQDYLLKAEAPAAHWAIGPSMCLQHLSDIAMLSLSTLCWPPVMG